MYESKYEGIERTTLSSVQNSHARCIQRVINRAIRRKEAQSCRWKGMKIHSRRRLLVLLLGSTLSFVCFDLYRKLRHQVYTQAAPQQNETLAHVTPRESVSDMKHSLASSNVSLVRILEEKHTLLFTFSELISHGTAQPSLPRPRCSDGIEDRTLQSYTRLSQYLKEEAHASGLVSSLKHYPRGIFVAALLHNSCSLASHFALELIKFALITGADQGRRIFISVLESGSTDCSRRVISLLKEILDTSNVPSNVRFGLPSYQVSGTRVDHLQMLRNEVLQDLYSSSTKYDEVVFLNDVYFCASDILKLLRHRTADIRCGLDMETLGNEPKFYDTWVARDISGNVFKKDFPFVSDPTSIEAVKHRLPFQVTCCWNGLAVLKADAFAKGVRFRRSILANECHASECEIICHDFAALGYPRVLVDPNVLVTYDAETFEALERSSGQVRREKYNSHYPSSLSAGTLKIFRDRPACSVCIPLDGSKGRDPDHKKSHTFNWLKHYQQNGVPVASAPNVTSLHNCPDTFARNCALSRGRRVEPVTWNASIC